MLKQHAKFKIIRSNISSSLADIYKFALEIKHKNDRTRAYWLLDNSE